MPFQSSFFLVPSDDGFRFHSPRRLEQLLQIQSPYNPCLAHAPYGKNAPHCSRRTNPGKRASASRLVDELVDARFPSTRAADLLTALSSCAVCGINACHQSKAPEVYNKWCHALWAEYLRAHGLDSRLHGSPPRRLTGVAWEDTLREAEEEEEEQARFEDSESDDLDSDADSESDDPDSDADSEPDGDYATPDTTFSNLEDPFDDAPSSGSHNSDDSGGGSEPSSSSPSPSPEPSAADASTEDNTHSDLLDDEPEVQSSPANNIGADAVDTEEEEEAVPADSTPQESDVEEAVVVASDLPATAPPHNPPLPEEEDAPFPPDLLALDPTVFEGPRTPTPIQIPPAAAYPPNFALYPQAPTPLAQLKQLLNTLTQTIARPHRRQGYLYAFARPSLPGYLKIGYVVSPDSQPDTGSSTVRRCRPHPDPVAQRLAKWAVDCGQDATEILRVRVACSARLESLVHLTLREERRVEACGRCRRRQRRGQQGGNGRVGEVGGLVLRTHDEWFEVELETARRVFGLWAQWAEQRPYDKFGRLGDFWAEKIESEKRQVGEGDSAMRWLEKMPRMVEELRRWELNSIHGSLARLST